VPARGAGGASGATGYRKGKTSDRGLSRKEVAETMGRFLDALNTPIAALVVLVVVVAVNAFLYLGYRPSETPSPPPAERSSGPQRTVERTEQPATPKEKTRPMRSTRPATTLQSTIPTEQSATPSASASATSSPSP
jgi:hypothetical protein